MAVQDRQPRPASRIQARRHAARWSTACSTRPPARAARSSRSTPSTGELRWMHAEHEGARAAASPRQLSGRGVAYWTDGRDERILYITTGYRLVALDAQTGQRIAVVRQRRHRRSEGRRGLRQGSADRPRHRRDRRALDAVGHEGRRRDGRIVVSRGRHAEDPQQHQGAGPRIRRAHRQAAVDVQHDSSSWRVRQRHVAERLVGGHRQHRRVEPDCGRRGARAGVPAGRDAELGFLRRPSAGQQPLRRKHRRDRLSRPASASGISSWCTIRSGTWTSRRRRCSWTSRSTAGR